MSTFNGSGGYVNIQWIRGLCQHSMDQGVMSTFNGSGGYVNIQGLLFTVHTWELIEFTDGENRPTVREFWHAYHIMKAIDNLSCMAGSENKQYEPNMNPI